MQFYLSIAVRHPGPGGEHLDMVSLLLPLASQLANKEYGLVLMPRHSETMPLHSVVQFFEKQVRTQQPLLEPQLRPTISGPVTAVVRP